MKTLFALALVGMVACAHNNNNGPVDKNHETSNAIDRLRDRTNNTDKVVKDQDVKRAKDSTNTNTK